MNRFLNLKLFLMNLTHIVQHVQLSVAKMSFQKKDISVVMIFWLAVEVKYLEIWIDSYLNWDSPRGQISEKN